jgi:MFS family permease
MPPIALLTAARPALASFAAMGMLWGSFAAALPDVKAMLGVDEAQLGLVLLASPVAAVAAMFAAPSVGHWLGRLALPAVTLAMGLAFALPGHAPGLATFALAMAACGAASGTLDVLMNTRVAAIEAARGMHLMNLAHAGYSLGYAAAAVATGAARAAGWSPGDILSGVALGVVILALLAVERDGRIEGLGRVAGQPRRGPGRVALLGGAIALVAFLTENAAEMWSALHIELTLGGSAAQGAWGPAAMALTMAAARIAGQGLITRLSPPRLLRWGGAVGAAGALIAAFAQSPAAAYAGLVVMAAGASVLAPTAFSVVGRLAAPDARARALARATQIGYFGYFIGPPLLGIIAATVGLRGAFVAGAVGLLGVLVLARQVQLHLQAAARSP